MGLHKLVVFCFCIKAVLRSSFNASALLEYLGPATVRLLGSVGDILSWMLLIVFSCWCVGIWDFKDCNSRCGMIFVECSLSLLCGCFVPWFLSPFWFLEEWCSCVWPVRKFSGALIGVDSGGSRQSVFLGIAP